MTVQKIGRVLLTLLAGLLSFAVTGYGLWTTSGIDFRFNPVLSYLFCWLALLCFPVFLFGIFLRKAVVVQAIMFIVYVAVYVPLNWRTCSAMGDCVSIPATILLTLETFPVTAFFGAVVCSFAALAIGKRPAIPAKDRP